ncbi:uncharacterized protein BDCG_09512 [Blastomyces dermatitidis ER-3]|uniref:Uncharacterized protein n=1 Tax=Ajellomyces dermatitidis (strain ER-3 / ATCC MYA-2586) TaxID=559297 RepID=A0ABP2EV28_AJEDR|nr:uncharacterized protein BDCG_09512 [Blastomyces dermatitidis ER-3]EEQ86243.2 hypothetical protein BDCG_09512 [Blastomyces dermatitidis ER-3]
MGMPVWPFRPKLSSVVALLIIRILIPQDANKADKAASKTLSEGWGAANIRADRLSQHAAHFESWLAAGDWRLAPGTAKREKTLGQRAMRRSD